MKTKKSPHNQEVRQKVDVQKSVPRHKKRRRQKPKHIDFENQKALEIAVMLDGLSLDCAKAILFAAIRLLSDNSTIEIVHLPKKIKKKLTNYRAKND